MAACCCRSPAAASNHSFPGQACASAMPAFTRSTRPAPSSSCSPSRRRGPRPASLLKPLIVAVQMDEAALRRAAREFTELADEIALKPAKPKKKGKSQ